MVKITTPIDQVDSTAQFTVGTRTQTKDGNEYIYLPGTTSVAQYDWVTIHTASALSYGSVTRMGQLNAGPVAIAQAAITGPNYGWFQVKGVGWGNAGEPVSAGSALYASGTTGYVGTTVASNHLIYRATAIGDGQCVLTAAGTCKVLINHPHLYGFVI